MNPLLDFSSLPRFLEIRPEHVTPAIDELLAENRALVERVATDPAAPAWDSFVAPLDDASERLSRAWGQVAHLNAVMNSPELREVYNGNLPRISEYYTELSQDERLFAKFRALRAAPGFVTLSREQKKIVENELRDFRLGGAELASEQKAEFKRIREQLDKLSSRFNDNLLDATNAFAHYVEERDALAGVPDDVLEAAAAAAAKDGKPGWKLTLHMPSYLPVMQYADNRGLRELMYRAYVTRAAEFGKPEWNNTPLIDEILELRRKLARLLGYRCYAEVSLEPKMAKTPEQVLEFLRDLGRRAKPFAQRDLKELSEFARIRLGLDKLEAWDIAWASEKLRVERYAFSEQEVKQYFPETKVLPGMFRLVETLYGIRIAPAEAPTWHPDVRFFEIRDADGTLVGQFYVDLYARPSKRGGAWMDDAITRKRVRDKIQTPVAYLNCSFSAPLAGKPALFTHSEVSTLFHEFGHGLHHLLTQAEQRAVSGINGVEWDAVELPSQFMENFCWEWSVVESMSGRAEGTAEVAAGTPLPRALFDKMLAAKNFQSGLQAVRQLEFALFDMHVHYDFEPGGSDTALGVLERVRQEIAVVFPPAYNRFPNNFAHIFAGGYAAGYYSYKWAEVLSADAFSLFEELGVLNPEVGRRFRREVLGAGGSRPAMESFVAFRGREPTIDALLRHSGMAVA